MARKKRTSKLPQSVINSSPYFLPAQLSCKSPDQLMQFIQIQHYRQSSSSSSSAEAAAALLSTPASHYTSHSYRNRGHPSSQYRDVLIAGEGGYPGGYQKRNVYHSGLSSRTNNHDVSVYLSAIVDNADQQLGWQALPAGNNGLVPNCVPPSVTDPCQMALSLPGNNKMELAPAGAPTAGLGMPPYTLPAMQPVSSAAAGGGLVSLPPPGVTALPSSPAPLMPSPGVLTTLPLASTMAPSHVSAVSAPHAPAAASPPPPPQPTVLHPSIAPMVNSSPWTCDEGHELCPQFGLHQCSCSSVALAREAVHDTPRPVPQPCFGSGEEILAISGGFPCIHFRFANLQSWLYYSICVELTVSSAESPNNYRDSLPGQHNTSVRFLPPGNHMPGHLWMHRRWSLQLEQIVHRMPHLPFGHFTPVIRLFATRGQLYQGQSLEGHPSDMIEASQNWYLSGHSFLLCPWAGDQRVLISTVAIANNHTKVDDTVEGTLSEISDPLSIRSESQSPPPCPREPWLDVEPPSCSSPDSVWGPLRTDSGCRSDDPVRHRTFNNLFPEGYFDESACVGGAQL